MWNVTGQKQTTDIGPSGGFETVWAVSWKDDLGHVGTVNIPVAMYDPAHVRAMIQAQVDAVTAVHGLTG